MDEDIPGVVYALADPRDGAIRYVGKTQRSLSRRIYLHIYDAKRRARKTHKEAWLGSLLNLGLMPVVLVIDEALTTEALNELECFWIALLRMSGERLTNATDGGEGVVNPTLATRAKISAAVRGKNLGRTSPMKGRTHSPEARALISQSQRGRPSPRKGTHLSAETIAKMSAALKGRETWNKGVPATDEMRAALRAGAAKRGPRPPVSEETRRRISEAQKGKPGRRHTEETKAKMSRSRMGHPVSEEARRKASLTQRRRLGLVDES